MEFIFIIAYSSNTSCYVFDGESRVMSASFYRIVEDYPLSVSGD